LSGGTPIPEVLRKLEFRLDFVDTDGSRGVNATIRKFPLLIHCDGTEKLITSVENYLCLPENIMK
jgi:hypothetical protein